MRVFPCRSLSIASVFTCSSHWYLAIICYPHLEAETYADGRIGSNGVASQGDVSAVQRLADPSVVSDNAISSTTSATKENDADGDSALSTGKAVWVWTVVVLRPDSMVDPMCYFDVHNEGRLKALPF